MLKKDLKYQLQGHQSSINWWCVSEANCVKNKIKIQSTRWCKEKDNGQKNEIRRKISNGMLWKERRYWKTFQ